MGSTWSEESRIVATSVWWLSVFTFVGFAAFDFAYHWIRAAASSWTRARALRRYSQMGHRDMTSAAFLL
eukprot:11208641-Lingulodinium_polyedra.AAC.1